MRDATLPNLTNGVPQWLARGFKKNGLQEMIDYAEETRRRRRV